MEFKINIERKHLLYTVFLVAIVGGIGLVVGYGGNNPTIMGHTWSEITCFDCLTSGNISTGAVTSDEILDKTIKDDDISLSANINGSKIGARTIPASALVSGAGGSGFASVDKRYLSSVNTNWYSDKEKCTPWIYVENGGMVSAFTMASTTGSVSSWASRIKIYSDIDPNPQKNDGTLVGHNGYQYNGASKFTFGINPYTVTVPIEENYHVMVCVTSSVGNAGSPRSVVSDSDVSIFKFS